MFPGLQAGFLGVQIPDFTRDRTNRTGSWC